MMSPMLRFLFVQAAILPFCVEQALAFTVSSSNSYSNGIKLAQPRNELFQLNPTSSHHMRNRGLPSSPLVSLHLSNEVGDEEISSSDDADLAPSDIEESSSIKDNNATEGGGGRANCCPEAQALKLEILKLCASYDRGYGASNSARKKFDEVIEKLEALNPTPMDAAVGIDGDNSTSGSSSSSSPPLKGIWRMVWTTALDVLNLGASPVASPGAIYQVIEPPVATNIIDFIPRAQSILPTNFPPTLLRAEVKTRTSSRKNMSNRVGLTFEAVSLKPVEVLGMTDVVQKFLPPFNLNFPQINLDSLPGVDPESAPGFFDVTYLDEDMLIIRQNAPGGYFVSINVPDCDP